MDIERFMNDLRDHEGVRKIVYDDATGEPLKKGMLIKGNPTIGVGRRLDSPVGLSEDEITYLLRCDVGKVLRDLDKALPWWRDLPEPSQRALANMTFNLGLGGIMKFQKMLAALKKWDFKKARKEALDSLWAKQVGRRSIHVANLYVA